jgi:hypothetical protein
MITPSKEHASKSGVGSIENALRRKSIEGKIVVKQAVSVDISE